MARETKEERQERLQREVAAADIAEDVWKNKLTVEEKTALKENIYYLMV